MDERKPDPTEALDKAEAMAVVLAHYIGGDRYRDAPLREDILEHYLAALRDQIAAARTGMGRVV